MGRDITEWLNSQDEVYARAWPRPARSSRNFLGFHGSYWADFTDKKGRIKVSILRRLKRGRNSTSWVQIKHLNLAKCLKLSLRKPINYLSALQLVVPCSESVFI